jgi:hypothetical protein
MRIGRNMQPRAARLEWPRALGLVVALLLGACQSPPPVAATQTVVGAGPQTEQTPRPNPPASVGAGLPTAAEPAAEIQAAADLDASLRATLEQRLASVLVLGASAADGFGLGLELKGKALTFADMFVLARGEALNAPTLRTPAGAESRLLRQTDNLFFLDPYGTMQRSVAAALPQTPTLVIAPDILFWFVYGAWPATERAQALERALGWLEQLRGQGARLIIGDVPYMEAASPLMLPLHMRASEEWVLAANQRIRAWAAERSGVALVGMHALMVSYAEDEAPAGPDWQLSADESADLLQADALHPSLLGSTLLFSLCMEAWIDLEACAEPAEGAAGLTLPERRQAWRRVLASALELNPQRLAERLRQAAASEEPPQAKGASAFGFEPF